MSPRISEHESINLIKEIWKAFGLTIIDYKLGKCFGSLPERFGDKASEYATLELYIHNDESSYAGFLSLLETLKKIEKYTGWEGDGFQVEGKKGMMTLHFNNFDYLYGRLI
jgi:hypothetical protein